ncbi:MAG: hypothetical protein RML37_12320, partial [Chitinophagales bacterium]|nr:hypothetical protein [Chitinophagales bacterium]
MGCPRCSAPRGCAAQRGRACYGVRFRSRRARALIDFQRSGRGRFAALAPCASLTRGKRSGSSCLVQSGTKGVGVYVIICINNNFNVMSGLFGARAKG